MAKDNVLKKGTSSKVQRAKKRKRRIAKVLTFVFFVAILISATILLLKHPTFHIVSFELEGTQRYTTDEITEKLQLATGKNIFLQTFLCHKENLAQLPYVNTVKFEYQLPNILKIVVTERTSSYVAFDKEKNKFFRLNEEGYILEEITIDKKEKEELLVHGITFNDEVILGEKINEIDMSKIAIFLEIKEEFEKSKINRNITKVNFENSLTTLTLNDKLNVIFPNNDELSYKMALLSEILRTIGEDAVGNIDLTKNNPTYSTF